MVSKKPIALQLSIKIIIIIVVSMFIGIFFTNDYISYWKGLLLGGIFSILKLYLMNNTISKAIMKQPHKAQTYSNVHYILRYLLTILVLVIGILEPSINFVGVIVGFFSMKIAAYWQAISEPPTPKDGSVEFLEWEVEEETDF